MKTILIIGLAFMMMFALAVPMALAEDNEIGNITEIDEVPNNLTASDVSDDVNYESSDTTPMLISENPTDSQEAEDNETASTRAIISNRVRTWFTFNQEKKAELELKLADLRLIQAKIAARNNDTEAMNKALEAHERLINKIEERIAGMKDKNVTGLQNAIAVHTMRLNKLQDILANANLTDSQRAKLQNKIIHLQNVTTKLEGVNQRIQEREENRTLREQRQQMRNNLSVNNESNDDSEDNETDVEDDSGNDDNSNGSGNSNSGNGNGSDDSSNETED